MNSVIRTPAEEALIDDLVAGRIEALIATCPLCEVHGRLVVVSDEEGPVDACCRPCADRPLLNMAPIEGILLEALRDRKEV